MHGFRRFPRPALAAALLCGALFLAGCQSDAEKAEDYFRSGMAFLEAGETEKALLELRNVFNHDGFHKEARRTYADTLLDLGRTQEAYGQYLRLIEQYPDTVEVRRILAEMAIARNDWDEADRHGSAAIALASELAPADPGVRALDLALRYRQASLARDDAARARIAEASQDLLDRLRAAGGPDNAALVRIVIDHLGTGPAPAAALPVLDAALERDPGALDLHIARLQLLIRLEDAVGTGAQLRRMAARFPENDEVQRSLIRWHLSQGDVDAAEGYLRDLAGADTGPAEGHVALVQLLSALRGPEAARAELQRLVAANAGTENARLYTAMLGSIDFDAGHAADGIATLRRALEGAEPNEQTRRIQGLLAKMLIATGAEAEAADLIAAILAEDAGNVAALKLRAAALIEDDRPGEAIVALRTALDQAPRDSEVLTLMALAHERDGDTDLMGERLALAVEVSGSGAAESLRYARFLMGQDRPVVAAAVLEDARRRAPDDLDLLLTLAELHLQQRDWPAAQAVAEALRAIDAPRAREAVVPLQAAILQGQNRTEDSLALLERQMDGVDPGDAQAVRAVAQIVQTQIRGGKIDEARAVLDETLAERPDVPDLRLLSASVHALMGEMEQAEAGYRALIDDFPLAERPVRLLIGVLGGTGRDAESEAVLDAALERQPGAPNLLWMQASLLERRGDIPGAIAVYERLYAADSSNTIVANNLASLITTQGTAPEDLDRAWAIARRLRGTAVPAFQDTYGWIAHLRGNMEEALEYLEPAAAGLPDNPLVHYHLGMTYAELGRDAAARTALGRALELAGDSPLPQFDTARDRLNALGD